VLQDKIYNITLEILQNQYYKEHIVNDLSNEYYWSNKWDEKLYIELAKMGFISTTYDNKDGLILLPELQLEYGILDFKNLHISKKVQKIIQKNDCYLSVNTQLDKVIEQFSIHHKYNWFKEEYAQLIKNIFKNQTQSDNFEIFSYELISHETQELIAGEIGYKIGKTYTSLSGFSSRKKKYANYGSLQLILLAQNLEQEGYEFWNLGHPHMEYKKKLGSSTCTRKEFLKRWNKAINL